MNALAQYAAHTCKCMRVDYIMGLHARIHFSIASMNTPKMAESRSHHAHTKIPRTRSMPMTQQGSQSRFGSTSTISMQMSSPGSSTTALRSRTTTLSVPMTSKWTPPPFYCADFHDEQAVRAVTYHTLGHTDMVCAPISLGGGPFAQLYGDCAEEVGLIVREALRLGISFIDTGYWYGHTRSEELIGKALRTVPRRAYYIGTRVGRYELDYVRAADYRAKGVMDTIDASLRRLRLAYVDLCQIQVTPDFEGFSSSRLIIEETLPAVMLAKRMRKCRYIGLCGYNLATLCFVVEHSPIAIDVVVVYSRGTMADGALGNYVPFFRDHHCALVNAGPMGQGLLTRHGPPAWHPASSTIRNACRMAQEYCQSKRICISRLALHSATSMPGVETCLVGVGTLPELYANLDTVTRHRHLSEKERRVRDRIQRRWLDVLANAHWEAIDLEQYWRKLKRLGLQRRRVDALPK